MLVLYICLNLAFGILRIIRWLLGGIGPKADDQSGHSPSALSNNQRLASRHPIIRNGKSQRVETIHHGEVTRCCEHNSAFAFADFEARVPPRSGSPALLHRDHDKIFKVLEGTFRFRCAGDVFDATPGTTVVIARSVEHSWINLGVTPGRISFTFVPGGRDDLLNVAAE